MNPLVSAVPTNNSAHPLPATCDVAVIGGGPSGLAAATHLKQAGVNSVIVLEREPDAGGIPRHCGHPPFGMREFKRCMTGPAYAARLVATAQHAGVDIRVNTSVARIADGGQLLVTDDRGAAELLAGRVVLCTGVRETPRAPRLISGQRPLGIFTTGALQSMVYLKGNIPFKRPIIIGTELVSFSALLTCRHAAINPVAMIEANSHITARAFCRPLPAMLGVPLHLNTRTVEILGKDRVTGVRVADANGHERVIEGDGVLFTGQFTPESSLLRMGHLDVDPASGGPVVDQYGRCSDPTYFATGNLLRPVETAGWCWKEGRQIAAIVARALNSSLPSQRRQTRLAIQTPLIRFAIPQVISAPDAEHQTGALIDDNARHLQLRFSAPANGLLVVRFNGQPIWSKSLSVLPERRVLVPMAPIIHHATKDPTSTPIEIDFTERD